MKKVDRELLGQEIARMVPGVIQGVHLGFLAERALTHTQFFVLAALQSRRECSMTVLAENMNVSMPTMSGVIDRLVQAGFVKRRPSPKDRRQVVVFLSPQGEALIKEFQSAISQRWQRVLTTLSQKDLESFYKIVLKLREGLEHATA